jgi:NTP pyrophosphatase (non-canonical NTP hydrolase)
MKVNNIIHTNKDANCFIAQITDWHYDRGLIQNSTDSAQYLKLISEAGELADNIAKGKCIKDDIGDMITVLINIAERNGLSIQECLEHAYNDIKDRTGYMSENGVYIKDE